MARPVALDVARLTVSVAAMAAIASCAALSALPARSETGSEAAAESIATGKATPPARQSSVELLDTANTHASVVPDVPDPLTPVELTSPALIAPGTPPPEPPTAAPTTAASPTAPPVAAAPAVAAIDPTIAVVRRRLAEWRGQEQAADRWDRAALTAFYEPRTTPIWVGPDGLTARGHKVTAEIRKADDWGLKASAFDVPSLAGGGGHTPEALADAEIKLGLAVLKYARHARGGRIPDPASISLLLDRKPRLYDPRSVMASIAVTDDAGIYLRGLHPRHAGFRQLQKALVEARTGSSGGQAQQAATAGSGPAIPPGPRIKPGQQHPHVALVRSRLGLKPAGGDDPARYDASLAKAVESYQRSQGLEPSAIITTQTRNALNGATTRRQSTGGNAETIQRLVVNMERWRWMPDDLGQFHVWDSVTEQMTTVFDNGKVAFHEKIVVGKPSTATPMFSANMQFVIFHPSWGVPNGIKTNELAPLLRNSSNDSGWLFSSGGPTASAVLEGVGGLKVSMNGQPINPDSVNWKSVDISRFDFTQPPGPKNVLGLVKFRFPNKHDVYMHDTPERNLFGVSQRTFSHGCMRVENPIRLAEVILAHDKGWAPERVRSMVTQGGGEVVLSKQIPVHIVYFTAIVGEDGRVQQKSDIYGLDSRIASALEGRSVNLSTPVLSEGELVAKVERQNRPRRGPGSTAVAGSSPGFNPFAGLFGN